MTKINLNNTEIYQLIKSRKIIKYVFNIYVFGLFSSLILFYLFFPGFVSIDSEIQFSQSKTLIFYDGSPPVMSWVWSKLNFISEGYHLMLLLHIIVFWLGIIAWNYGVKNSTKINVFFILGFLPWVINFQGVIWKDVGMASALLLASGILSKNKNSIYEIIIVFFLLLYAFMVRVNSIVAVVPLLWYLIYKISSKPKLSFIYCLIIIIFKLLFLNYFNYSFLNAKKDNMQTYIMIDDLTHLSVLNKKSLIPNLNLKIIEKCSKQKIAQTYLVGRLFCYINENEYKNIQPIEYNKLKNNWINAIKQYPFDYLKFRINSFLYLLRDPYTPLYNYFYTGHFNKEELSKTKKFFITNFENYIKLSAKFAPFFFKPYFWLILSIVGILLTFFLKLNTHNKIIIRCLFTSGLLYILGYLPVTFTADLRYTYWSSIAVTFGIIKILTSFKLKN